MKRRYDYYNTARSNLSNQKPKHDENSTLKQTIKNAFYNPSTLNNLSKKLPETLSMGTCEFLLFKISLYIKSNSLSSDIKPIISELATVTFNQFDNLLSQAPKDLDKCKFWMLTQLQTRLLERDLYFYSIIVAKLLRKEFIHLHYLPIIWNC